MSSLDSTKIELVDEPETYSDAGHVQGHLQYTEVAHESFSQRAEYPWSQQRLLLPPPVMLPKPGVQPPTEPSPSPFPRYGAALPAVATPTEDLFLFGGLVGDQIRNDLYLFSTTSLSATLLQTTGDAPSPRVGHASALIGSVLIVWGGDTMSAKGKRDGMQDDGLYLLNVASREWARIVTDGPTPSGRYGHSMVIVGSAIYVFGGQVDGEFMNDLWMFELNCLRSTPQWELIEPAQDSPQPAKRTGHTCIAIGERLILFGGTDLQYRYNDTWCFDTTTRNWQELDCIGYIPPPREGHAAAIVDDMIYIFGGRGVDGKDLGDLYAFKMPTQRWYMFAKMGPAPSARSGHAMAAIGSRVFVLGGMAGGVLNYPAEREAQDDPNMIHVLDTKRIKYPGPTMATPASYGPTPPLPRKRKSSRGLDAEPVVRLPGPSRLFLCCFPCLPL